MFSDRRNKCIFHNRILWPHSVRSQVFPMRRFKMIFYGEMLIIYTYQERGALVRIMLMKCLHVADHVKIRKDFPVEYFWNGKMQPKKNEVDV